MDLVEQPCQVTALHHIGKYGGLGGAFFLCQTVECQHEMHSKDNNASSYEMEIEIES